MKAIQAFVGHSFTDDDAEIVRKFLKFFDQLSQLHPTFSWAHAEPAEPKILADKVMRLMEGKNLFIGICTKKERVILPNALKKTFLSRAVLKGREPDFYWKTSDWIIQEIGLAKGRGLDLILLIEEGLRKPGGLQGDLEHILFAREAPERSFGKILEMVNALSPKTASAITIDPEPRAEPIEDKVSTEAPADREWTRPKATWIRRDYKFALMHFVATNDVAGAANINDAYLATQEGMQEISRQSWESYVEVTRLTFGKGGQLASVKRLSEKNPNNSEIFSHLAEAYGYYEQFNESAIAYESAASNEKVIGKKLGFLREAAIAYQRADNSIAAFAKIVQMKSLAPEDKQVEIEVLRTQRKLFELAKNNELLVGSMERLLDIDPSDNEIRFALAHKHSELGQDALSLFHYLRIPYSERSAAAWNNLGVEFSETGLPAKSVDAYRASAEKRETLAMSNLANKFIDAGFLKEAEEICSIAIAEKDSHKNVGKSFAQLKAVPEAEEKKMGEILEKAKPLSEFYKQFGRAIAKVEPTFLEGQWKGPECVLRLTIQSKTIVATGSYELPSGGILARAMMGKTFALGQADCPPHRYQVEYRGNITGAAIVGYVVRKREDTPRKASTILTSDEEPKLLMYLCDNGNDLRILEINKTGHHFYSFLRESSIV